MVGVLAVILFAWEPLRVARELEATLGSFGMRGLPAVVEILVHGAVAALSVAGAQALWNRSPLGPRLAAVALIASVASDIQSLYWSSLPGQTMPGDKAPLAILATAHAAAWLGYLWKSDRVRAMASGSG